MSSTSLTFGFDNVNVRVILDKNGEPWWVAKDVCDALGIESAERAYARLDDDEKVMRSTHVSSIKEIGVRTTQKMVTISESGLYSLILGSRLESAKRFKRWVTSEVLPSIRRTGGYSVKPQGLLSDKMQALLMLGDAMQKVPGVQPGIMAAHILQDITANTGLTLDNARLAIPAAEKPFDGLNATNLGKTIGLGAVATNKLLCERGLQIKNARGEWELTEEGKKFGEALPYSRHGHAGYQLFWHADTLK